MRLYVEHHLSCAKSDHPAAMTLPREIGDAAQNGDRDRVMAWLDAGGSIDDVDTGGYTLLNCCAVGDKENELIIGDRQVALARHLITLGADVNIASTGVGFTPLLHTVYCRAGGQGPMDMLSLLLTAKADVNAQDFSMESPLCVAIERPSELRTAMITELLRYGASLDACRGNETAEDVILGKERNETALAENQDWRTIKRLVAGVRQHGSYKRYARSFHRDVLAVRGLAQRGKLSTEHRALNFLARLGDNGVVWHVLEYWRATN